MDGMNSFSFIEKFMLFWGKIVDAKDGIKEIKTKSFKNVNFADILENVIWQVQSLLYVFSTSSIQTNLCLLHV
jgi:hypothetical protein